jgi:hypothetical protein
MKDYLRHLYQPEVISRKNFGPLSSKRSRLLNTDEINFGALFCKRNKEDFR